MWNGIDGAEKNIIEVDDERFERSRRMEKGELYCIVRGRGVGKWERRVWSFEREGI